MDGISKGIPREIMDSLLTSKLKKLVEVRSKAEETKFPPNPKGCPPLSYKHGNVLLRRQTWLFWVHLSQETRLTVSSK